MMAFGGTVASTAIPLGVLAAQCAGLVCHSQALSQQQLQLVAETVVRVARVRALVPEGVLKNLFLSEELEIRVVRPPHRTGPKRA